MYRKIWNKDFVLLTLSNFLLCITYYSLISTLPIYLVTDLHAGKSAVGIVVASYTIASVIVRPFSGFALDKFGRRTIFLTSLLVYTAFMNGYLVAFSIGSLIILRFAQGITWGIATIAESTMAIDIIPPQKRGEGIGYFGLSTTLGMSVGPVIGLFVIHHWGYTIMFISVLAISIASLITAYFIRLPKQFLLKSNIKFTIQNLFYINSIIPSLNLLIIMSTYGGLLSFIALYGREMGIRNTSYFFLVFAIGIGISRLITGKIFDKKGPKNLLTICLTLMIIGFPCLALFKNPVGYYVSSIIIGFGIGVVFPSFQTMISNMADAGHRGAANSTLYTALDLGMGMGMVLMGFIAQKTSISVSFLVSSVIILVGLIFFRGYVVSYYNHHLKK